MNSKHFKVDGRDLTIHFRDLPGVAEIIQEVVVDDCYRFQQLRNCGVVFHRVIDVGAHMGIACAMMRHFWPKVEILAIEPHEEYAEFIVENGADYIFSMAVQYDRNRVFYASPISGGSLVYEPSVNFCEDIPETYTERLIVPIVPLEEIVNKVWKDGAIDLLKLDCEGSEFDILCNMTAPLRNRIRSCIGELHHIAGFRFIEQIIKLRYPHWNVECWGDPNASMSMFAALPKAT